MAELTTAEAPLNVEFPVSPCSGGVDLSIKNGWKNFYLTTHSY